MEEVTLNKERIMAKVLKITDSKEWCDALAEFRYDRYEYNHNNSHCACGIAICHIFYIQHRQSKKELQIGSECIKWFRECNKLYKAMIYESNLLLVSKRKKIPSGLYTGKTYNHVYTKHHDYFRKLDYIKVQLKQDIAESIQEFYDFCVIQDKLEFAKLFNKKDEKKCIIL